MTRRAWTVLVSAVVVVVLVAGISMMPVPYVAMAPGSAINVLGQLDNKQIIRISGVEVSQSQGSLDMTTVSVIDGIDLITAVRYWFDDETAVVPRATVFPPGQTQQQRNQESSAQFNRSQSTAEVAALRVLGYPPQILVSEIAKNAPVAGKLAPGDIILAIDGNKISSGTNMVELIQKHDAGENFPITINRNGQELTVEVAGQKHPQDGQAIRLGFSFEQKQEHPFEISFDLGGIGGPSAGLIFALAIVDKVDPVDLTGGRNIAGTGEINDEGQVGPIGGINQKLIAARQSGATAFLTPEDNCAQALRQVPAGLQLIKISTLDDALTSLSKLREGKKDIPRCRS